MQKLVHLIADYAPGDLAFSEIISALTRHLPEGFHWHYTSVSSFDTLATGFIVGQLGLQDEERRPRETIIYANCAPRRDLTEARRNNEGERFSYGVLTNDVPVLVVNAGYSLSFVRDHLKELWTVHVDRGGSQFRSRDNFPAIVGQLAHKDFSFKAEKANPKDCIPEYPKGVIAYIDSFGNFKTTYRQGDPEVSSLEPGKAVSLTINGHTRQAYVATGSFNVKEGEIAFAPGSSGHQARFWEVFRRGASAAREFGYPSIGATVAIAGC
jgi:hypothetical protein